MEVDIASILEGWRDRLPPGEIDNRVRGLSHRLGQLLDRPDRS